MIWKLKKSKIKYVCLMQAKTVILSIVFLLMGRVLAQENVLLTIDHQTYTVDDFLWAYNKNNADPLPDNLETLKEQVNKFANLKLLIIEAKNAGLDKTNDFIYEYNQYKRQIADDFLIDEQKFNQLLTQSYERLKKEVRLSHILIKVSPYADPLDTLIAYQKAMNIHLRLTESESFENVAKECSDDPTAAFNGGDLWYIHAFKIPFAFENYIYQAKVQKLPKIVRTELGYEIFKVKGYRTNPGMLKVAHIMVSVSANANKEELAKAKRKIEHIYNKLLLGESFEDLVKKYSDDIGINNKGELPWFGTGEMDTVFEKTSINLRIGEFSKPVKTKYGWHIIKKIDQQGIQEFTFLKDQLSKAIRENKRYQVCKQNIESKYKKLYNFKEYNNLSVFYDMVDSALIFDGKWEIPIMAILNDVIFKIANQEFKQRDFANFLVKYQKKSYPVPLKNYINEQYKLFRNQAIMEFAYEQLSKTNKDYIRLTSKLSDAILLFKYLKKELWYKAQNDTLALIDYYKKKYNDYNKYYADISVFKFSPDMNIKKMKKLFLKYKKQNINNKLLAKIISKSTKSNFTFSGTYRAEEGNNEDFDLLMNEFYLGKLAPKQKLIILNENHTLIYLNSQIRRTQKSWTVFKSELIDNYQKYLEKKLTNTLRKKHTVEINKEVLKTLLY